MTLLYDLVKLAEKHNLAKDGRAFEEVYIPAKVVLQQNGGYHIHQLSDDNHKKGRKYSAPKKYHPNAPGHPDHIRYMTEKRCRIFPSVKDKKEQNEKTNKVKRQIFWKNIEDSGRELKDPAIQQMLSFYKQICEDVDLCDQINEQLDNADCKADSMLVFEYHDDGGMVMLDKENIRQWHRNKFNQEENEGQKDWPVNICSVTGKESKIALIHPKVRTPAGDASLVSGNQDGYLSYGFPNSIGSGVSVDAANKYAIALEKLLKNDITTPSGRKLKSCINLLTKKKPKPTYTYFVFYTDDINETLISLLDKPLDDEENVSSDKIDKLIRSPMKGSMSGTVDLNNLVHFLVLTVNKSRISVYNYEDYYLNSIAESIKAWFQDLSIVSSKDGKQITNNFSLHSIIKCFVPKDEYVSPKTYVSLFKAAICQEPLGSNIWHKCLTLISKESKTKGDSALSDARMAFLKLVYNRYFSKGEKMNHKLDESKCSVAYLWGQLFGLYSECVYSCGSNNSFVHKNIGPAHERPLEYYNSLTSKIYRVYLPQIQKNKEAFFKRLTRDIALVTDKIDWQTGIPETFDEAEKMQFLLGFHHNKAESIKRRKEAKEKTEKS